MNAGVKAIIPAAGLGTRLLPATKSVPKELLPLVDKPTVQYAVEEAVAAGLRQVVLVTGDRKQAVRDHFERDVGIEELLAGKGDLARLARIRACADLAEIRYVRQDEPRGVGHAVLCTRDAVGEGPVGVILPDEIITPSYQPLERMIALRERLGGSVLALTEVDPSQIHLYGCAEVEPTADEDVVRVTGLVEKPGPGRAPSNLAVVGRFVLAPGIFAELEHTAPGHGGEIQLVDALDTMARSGTPGAPVHGVILSGERYDTGNLTGYLRATVELACDHPDIGPAFRSWLKEFVDRTSAGS